MTEKTTDGLDVTMRKIESLLIDLVGTNNGDLGLSNQTIPLLARIAPANRPLPGLPAASLLRDIFKARSQRRRFFGDGLFADPAWDMILDLATASARNERVSVKSLCIASGVPTTTALRWIENLVDRGIAVRYDDEVDRRRRFVELSQSAKRNLARYFSEVGSRVGAGI